MNTQLYHRYANNYHVRISNASYAPMTFYRDRTKYLSYSNDLQDSLTNQTYQWRNCKNRQNKSSLPLLEPLLLMPELTSSEHSKGNKNQPECGENCQNSNRLRVIIFYSYQHYVLRSLFYLVAGRPFTEFTKLAKDHIKISYCDSMLHDTFIVINFPIHLSRGVCAKFEVRSKSYI